MSHYESFDWFCGEMLVLSLGFALHARYTSTKCSYIQ